MTTSLILIIALGAGVFAGILALVVWAIRTAHHDHHAVFSGAPWHHRRTTGPIQRRGFTPGPRAGRPPERLID